MLPASPLILHRHLVAFEVQDINSIFLGRGSLCLPDSLPVAPTSSVQHRHDLEHFAHQSP